jgi:hypothetical protein
MPVKQKNFHFIYTISGKDVNKNQINDSTTYHINLQASKLAIAEKKLSALYYRSVKIHVQHLQVTDIN